MQKESMVPSYVGFDLDGTIWPYGYTMHTVTLLCERLCMIPGVDSGRFYAALARQLAEAELSHRIRLFRPGFIEFVQDLCNLVSLGEVTNTFVYTNHRNCCMARVAVDVINRLCGRVAIPMKNVFTLDHPGRIGMYGATSYHKTLSTLLNCLGEPTAGFTPQNILYFDDEPEHTLRFEGVDYCLTPQYDYFMRAVGFSLVLLNTCSEVGIKDPAVLQDISPEKFVTRCIDESYYAVAGSDLVDFKNYMMGRNKHCGPWVGHEKNAIGDSIVTEMFYPRLLSWIDRDIVATEGNRTNASYPAALQYTPALIGLSRPTVSIPALAEPVGEE